MFLMLVGSAGLVTAVVLVRHAHEQLAPFQLGLAAVDHLQRCLLVLVRGKVDKAEAFRATVTASGNVRLVMVGG